MKVFEIRDRDGRPFAFEISNCLCGRHWAQAFINRIHGVTILRRQRRFQLRSVEDFCEFELEGERFVISEPWGDNSRYWIGQQPPRPSPPLELLRKVFVGSSRFKPKARNLI